MNGPGGTYTSSDLRSFAAALLAKAGLPDDRADIVSKYLVEADLMGHVTHGLNLLPSYLDEIAGGRMTKRGEPEVLSDRGSSLLWDGKMLPGIWLTWKALDSACGRMEEHPVVTVVIRRSHHIGGLAAYLPGITDRGLFCLISCSDPSGELVAPFGGKVPLYTPNPLAAGIPAGEGSLPILIDISTSVTSLGVVNRHRKMNRKLPGQWLLDAGGNPSDDPEVMGGNPRGSIMPLGGMDSGYKGFALGLLIEAMTSALGGHGRAEKPEGWGASVFIQVINPEAFGGRSAFEREIRWLSERSRENPPRPGTDRVRLPGERALELRHRQLEHGVSLDPMVMPALLPWAESLGVPPPRARER